MDDVQRALAAAWKKIRPRLERDAEELRRRLARRRGVLLQSPPRAWCLAIRASDTRISDETRVNLRPGALPNRATASARTRLTESTEPGSANPIGLTESGSVPASADAPLSAPLPAFIQHSSFSIQHSPHSLILDADDLRALCAPVHLDAPGEPLKVVADKLGTTPHGLLNARLRKRFHVRHLPALDGRWGTPHPILYCAEPLDPASRGFFLPDALWSITAPHLAARIPKKLRATLTRIPVFHDATRDYRDKSDLHPEHPDVDRTFDTRPKPRSRKLPPPEPDYVSYKWKGDVFVGYAWRDAETNTLIRENYERHQRELARYRDYNRNRRRKRPSQSSGSLKFRGWAWLCPKCGRRVNVLFYPLPRLHLLPGKIPRLPRDEMRELDLPHPHNQFFACAKCHHVRYFSRGTSHTWWQVVSYLSGGLLYGSEVERPAWFKPQRKIPFKPRPMSKPSARRAQVERLLLAGRTPVQIAAELGLSIKTICNHTAVLYARAGVRTRGDFLNQHGHNLPPPPRLEIRRRILAGEPTAQILTELGCSKKAIYDQREQLRRRGIKLPDARTRNARRQTAGLHQPDRPLPTPHSHSPHPTRRLLAGQSIKQIETESGCGKRSSTTSGSSCGRRG